MPDRQRLLGAGLVLGVEFLRVTRIDVLEAELVAIRDAIGFGEFAAPLDELLEFHDRDYDKASVK